MHFGYFAVARIGSVFSFLHSVARVRAFSRCFIYFAIIRSPAYICPIRIQSYKMHTTNSQLSAHSVRFRFTCKQREYENDLFNCTRNRIGWVCRFSSLCFFFWRMAKASYWRTDIDNYFTHTYTQADHVHLYHCWLRSFFRLIFLSCIYASAEKEFCISDRNEFQSCIFQSENR